MTQALTLTESQTKAFMVRTYAWMAFALFISAAAAYFTAQNIFTITKYDGLDQEVNGGIDYYLYARPFTTVLGLNLNF